METQEKIQNLNEKAMAAIQSQDYTEALPLLLQLTDLPQPPKQLASAWGNLAFVYSKLGQHAEAVHAVEQAIDSAPTEPIYRLNRAIFTEPIDLPAAQTAYKDYFNLVASNSMAFNNAGVVADQLGQQDVAEQHFRKALALNASNAHAQLNLASLLTKAGQYAAALPVLEAIVGDLTNTLNFVLAKARCLYNLGRYSEALPFFDVLTQLQPSFAPHYYYKAMCLKNANEINSAMRDLVNAMNRDPTESTFHWELAQLYKITNKIDLGIQSCYKMMQMEPNNPRRFNSCGIWFTSVGLTADALVCFEKAVTLQPLEFSYWFNKATVLRALRKWKELKEVVADMEKFEKKQAWLWCTRAEALFHLNQVAESLQAYKQSYAAEPNETVLANIHALEQYQ